MRQVAGFTKVINKAKLVDFYNSTLSYATIHGAKMPSLEEYLGISSNEETHFDSKAEAALEAHAKKRLKERQEKLGSTT